MNLCFLVKHGLLAGNRGGGGGEENVCAREARLHFPAQV